MIAPRCGTITSPLTRETASPSSVATTADECLDPTLGAFKVERPQTLHP